jgi:hypothetical protein
LIFWLIKLTFVLYVNCQNNSWLKLTWMCTFHNLSFPMICKMCCEDRLFDLLCTTFEINYKSYFCWNIVLITSLFGPVKGYSLLDQMTSRNLSTSSVEHMWMSCKLDAGSSNSYSFTVPNVHSTSICLEKHCRHTRWSNDFNLWLKYFYFVRFVAYGRAYKQMTMICKMCCEDRLFDLLCTKFENNYKSYFCWNIVLITSLRLVLQENSSSQGLSDMWKCPVKIGLVL